ncbi:MAG: phenylacetate--CoA ligase [Acidobacteria bacterium]|nr:phenylacetate--CoA ligase [Acidobacteriota bacterium]
MVHRANLESAPPEQTRARQLERFNLLLSELLPHNHFYASKFKSLSMPIDWHGFAQLPFTTKPELVEDQSAFPPLGTIATYPRERYLTYHQTSGTTGRPLVVLDTPESWDWWTECWQYIYRAAGVTDRDRLFMAFSFGPFIGFWAAHAAALKLGALGIPGGGLDSKARLHLMASAQATVLLSTPTYALRLAEVARQEDIDLSQLGVHTTIHAGEPGASLPSVRDRIQRAWGAKCFDHAGATEVGAYGYTCDTQTGLHVIESEFIAEVLDPQSGQTVSEGSVGELVLTNLGRVGWPVIRYRTGDLVQMGGCSCPCGRTFQTLPGGLIGRADDLMVVRGINIYPSSIEAIIREFEVDEFRIVRTRQQEMDELFVEVEASTEVANALADAFSQHLAVRIETQTVAPASLPRFELKANRVVDRRGDV